MKKVHLIAALSGFLLVSCAQDDLVVKPGSPTDGSPVTFAMNIGNMSRANTALENAGFTNFGVWAVKANGLDDFLGLNLNLGTHRQENAQVVMNDYWVQYCPQNQDYGSFWSYDPQNWPDSWNDNTTVTTKPSQFLKYWDGSFVNTYFVAYAPAYETVVFSNGYDAANSTTGSPTLSFPNFTTTAVSGDSFIYSDVTAATNDSFMTDSPENPSKVSLTFHRVLSQLQIAFWEDIPGYDVELMDLSFSNETTTATGYTPHGVVAMPADYTAASDTWARGSYINSGTPTVTFSGTNLSTSSLSFKNCGIDDSNLEFALPTGDISVNHSTPSYSPTVFNVLPNESASSLTMTSGTDYKANSGLQFVVNFKLKATDTQEVIEVKGARVYVPANFTAWKNSTLYTYVFQITRNASGNTKGDDPDPNPDKPDNALYPIIFDNLLVEDLNTGTVTNDFVINQKLSDLYININGGLTAQSLSLQYIPDDVTYTWTSSAEGVATVTPDASTKSATVTPVAAGTTTITVKDNDGQPIASCTVYVYDLASNALDDDIATVKVGSTTTLTSPFSSPLTGTWSSSDAAKATVADGVVTGVKEGEVEITCSCPIAGELKTKTWTVTVNPAP